MTTTILIIEDDPNISELIRLYAEKEGFRALVSPTADGAFELLPSKPDCIILDLMLPGLSGIDFLKQLRQESLVPVIIASAKSEELDTLLGLELGADDYVSKPFSPKELMARVKAVLRRSQASKEEATQEEEEVAFKDLAIDSLKMRVQRGGKMLKLSPIEFRLIHLFASHPGQVFSRDQLMAKVYDSDHHYVFDRTIDGHIKNLRRKLGDKPKKPKYIESVFGVGYKSKED